MAGADDAGFTLDPRLLEARRAAAARRLHTVQVPLMRLAGFVILVVLAALHRPHPLADPAWQRLAVLDLGYALAAWAALRWGWRRTGRVDLALLFFHLDPVVWLATLHAIEPAALAYGYLLLVRVADQVGFGFKRAFYFVHVVVAVYLGYGVLAAALDPAAAHWPARLGIAATMYLVGCYLAATGLVTERLLRRLRQAVRTARDLVASLEERTRELEASRREAEQASRAKSQFLAMISHEIRTPMNGILGTTELMLWGPLDGVQRELAQTAHDSARALLGLIDGLLDLSRIEAGKLALEPAPFDPRALIDGVAALMRPVARARRLALEVQVDADVPERLSGDALRLRQVLVNLVGNALKFTHAGRVDLRLRREGGRLRFEVADTGIGIPPALRERIFEPFVQADASTTRDYGGSGLGLAIVRQLVGLMGGEVGVSSEPGRGSRFWFALDLPAVQAPEAAPDLPAPAGAARVLLAEDNPVNQLVLQAMLQNLGCSVEVVGDGAAACAAAEAGRFDLVLMDCHMPGTDGYEATRRIRAREALAGSPRLPIVALTAAALPEDRERCHAAGMDDFLAKPAAMAQLAAVLARWAGPAHAPR